jgi:hypothetical protein
MVLVHENIYFLKIKQALSCLYIFILNYPALSKETRLAMAVYIVAIIAYIYLKNIIYANFSTYNIFIFNN